MAHFSCPRCLYTVATPFCPSCNQFLTDDIALAESVMLPPKAPSAPMQWCTAFGHWGDVFMCCGLMQALLRETGQKTVNVLYVGPDIALVEWLKAQPFVGDVIGIKQQDKGYEHFWGATTKPGNEPRHWLPILWESVWPLPDMDAFTQTHINAAWFETRGGLPAQVWTGGNVPESAHTAVQQLLWDALPIRTGKVFHLHPVSTWSELAGNHWAHWLAAIEWLMEKTPHTYLLTGLQQMPFLPTSPRLINLIGKAKTNMEVMALGDYCDGVISTPNSIALWSVIARQKCLCVGNKATQFLTSYYRRFLQRGERLTYLNIETPFSGFQAAACAWLEESA